jgi:undecaprenyl-diphosphatase
LLAPSLRVGVAAFAVFVVLGIVVHQHRTVAFDDAVRAWLVSNSASVGVAFFSFVSTYGSVTPMIVYSAAALLILSIRRRSMLPLIGLIPSAAAVLAYLGTKSIVQRTRPSGVGNAFEGTYSFPSAHATTSSAVCCTIGYLLWRERVVSGSVAMVIATLAPFVIGLSRVYLDVHWATDVIGGWCLGLAIAALTAVLYECISRPVADGPVAVNVQ